MNMIEKFDRIFSLCQKLEEEQIALQERQSALKLSASEIFQPVLQKMHEIGDCVIDGKEMVRVLDFVFQSRSREIDICQKEYFTKCIPGLLVVKREDLCGVVDFCEYFHNGEEFDGETFVGVASCNYYDYASDNHFPRVVMLPKRWLLSDDWAEQYKELFDKELEKKLVEEAVETKKVENHERAMFEKLKAKFEQKE